MTSVKLNRRIALAASGAAVIGMGFLTAGCSDTSKEPAPSTTTTTSTSPSATSAPALSPTEKSYIQPVPSIEDRGGMDSHSCLPGQAKINGICQ